MLISRQPDARPADSEGQRHRSMGHLTQSVHISLYYVKNRTNSDDQQYVGFRDGGSFV